MNRTQPEGAVTLVKFHRQKKGLLSKV